METVIVLCLLLGTAFLVNCTIRRVAKNTKSLAEARFNCDWDIKQLNNRLKRDNSEEQRKRITGLRDKAVLLQQELSGARAWSQIPDISLIAEITQFLRETASEEVDYDPPKPKVAFQRTLS